MRGTVPPPVFKQYGMFWLEESAIYVSQALLASCVSGSFWLTPLGLEGGTVEPSSEVGGIFLWSIFFSAQACVFGGDAELFARARNAAVETTSPSFPRLWEGHSLEALFRDSSFNGINKHPRKFPVLDTKGDKG